MSCGDGVRYLIPGDGGLTFSPGAPGRGGGCMPGWQARNLRIGVGILRGRSLRRRRGRVAPLSASTIDVI
jgi:hypothetical protein